MTDVVIMCGGRGTRLKPATETIPKPLLSVGERPILDHVIGHFLRYGFRRFVLCLGYRANAIRAHFHTRANGGQIVSTGRAESVEVGDPFPFTVVLVDTGLDTDTGGRLKRAGPYVDSESFVVAYADVLSDVDLTGLSEFHRKHMRLATVTAARPMSPFGHLMLGDDDAVSGFLEKPRLNDWVNIGYAMLERPALQRVTIDSPQLEVGLLPDLAREGQLSAFRHHGRFEPMDSYADYTRLNEMCRSGKLDLTDERVVPALRERW